MPVLYYRDPTSGDMMPLWIPELKGATVGGIYTPAKLVAYSATLTLDCRESNAFEVAALTGNVTTFTLSNPGGAQSIVVRMFQDATGGRTVATPAGAKIDGSMPSGPNAVGILTLYYSARASRFEGWWNEVAA